MVRWALSLLYDEHFLIQAALALELRLGSGHGFASVATTQGYEPLQKLLMK